MSADQIPVIDISGPHEDVGGRLVNAVHVWGFAFVRGNNTGFTAPLLNHVFALVFSLNREDILLAYAGQTHD